MEIAVLLAALAVLLALAAGWYLRQRRDEARALYEQQLEAALADGILTPEETAGLRELRASRELTEAEARMVALAIYRRALRDAAADARFTDDEQQLLARLQAQLGLTVEDLSADREQLHRLWLLSRVERGRLPRLRSPLPLAEQELCHWVVRASLAQRTGLPDATRREPAAATFSLDEDRPFEVNVERDALDADPRILPIDVGSIILTDRRLIFRGAKRRLQLAYVMLSQLSLYRDAIRVASSDGTSAMFLVEDAELTAAILLRAARLRRLDLGGRPARTA